MAIKISFWRERKRLALGVYPAVPLIVAREKREQARKLLASKIDPSHVKKEEKINKQIIHENSFETVAREWHSNKLAGWTPRHADYVIRRLQADIFPTFGFKPVDEITAPELLSALRVIEARGAIDIAHRAHQTCGQIFR